MKEIAFLFPNLSTRSGADENPLVSIAVDEGLIGKLQSTLDAVRACRMPGATKDVDVLEPHENELLALYVDQLSNVSLMKGSVDGEGDVKHSNSIPLAAIKEMDALGCQMLIVSNSDPRPSLLDTRCLERASEAARVILYQPDALESLSGADLLDQVESLSQAPALERQR